MTFKAFCHSERSEESQIKALRVFLDSSVAMAPSEIGDSTKSMTVYLFIVIQSEIKWSEESQKRISQKKQ